VRYNVFGQPKQILGMQTYNTSVECVGIIQGPSGLLHDGVSGIHCLRALLVTTAAKGLLNEYAFACTGVVPR
jgi:hypothetical protein